MVFSVVEDFPLNAHYSPNRAQLPLPYVISLSMSSVINSLQTDTMNWKVIACKVRNDL